MSAPAPKDIERFVALFRGRDSAYGQYTVEDDGFTKVEDKTFTKEEPIPHEAWVRHLSGQNPGIGIVPVTETGNCYWGAIDYDDPVDPMVIEKRVRDMDFPLVVARSKSGGVHLYAFLIDPVGAEVMQLKLGQWAKSLGLEMNTSGVKGGGRSFKVEIFPKQGKSQVGNWINLPYFGTGKSNLRWGVKDGKRLSFGKWLDYAESMRLSSLKFRGWHTHDPASMFMDGPPCLEQLHKDGVGEGMRNTVLYNMAMYFKLKNPDGWADDTHAYNEEWIDPPLPHAEVERIIGSVASKPKQYQCDVTPLCDLCKEKDCKKREYGISAFFDPAKLPSDMPSLGRLVYLDTEPAAWIVPVAGTKVQVTTAQLLSGANFRTAVTEQMGIYFPPMKQQAWDQFLKQAMADKETIEVPKEMGSFGRFLTLFGQFMEQRLTSTSDNDLRRGKPVEKEGSQFGHKGEAYVLFTIEGLRSHLEQNRFTAFTDSRLYSVLRDLGGNNGRTLIEHVSVRFWYLPLAGVMDLLDEKEFDFNTSDDQEPSF